MAKRKKQSKKEHSANMAGEIGDQLEHAFLAGLGALSNAQKVGGNAFDKLVKEGKSFRKETTHKTEELIDEVQDSIRSMAEGAQSRADGLLSHMRETPQLEKLQDVFDSRVAGALGRMGIASRQSIDELNSKLDRVIKAMEKDKRAKTAVSRKKSAKKVAKKKPAKKKPAKKATKKTNR